MAEKTEEQLKYETLTAEAEKLQNEYASRKFSYNPDADKGYQDYVRLMRENGKAAMEDTVGKVSALTGGYGNSWAVSAGQQAYNQYAKQAAEAQATYRQLARSEFDAENQDILNRLSMINTQKAGVYQDPTKEQIDYAIKVFGEGGDDAVNAYTAQLQGVDTSAIYAAIDANESKKKQDELAAFKNEMGWQNLSDEDIKNNIKTIFFFFPDKQKEYFEKFGFQWEEKEST